MKLVTISEDYFESDLLVSAYAPALAVPAV